MKRAFRIDSGKAIGARMRLIRKAFGGMSQAEIARLTGIGASTWNNAETGDNRLGLDSAVKLRGITGATLDFIYLGERASLPFALAIEIARIEAQNPHC